MHTDLNNRLHDEIDHYVERLEVALATVAVNDLVPFAPPNDHEFYGPIVRELVRVEIEYRYRDRCPRSLTKYRELFPRAFATTEDWADVAFEDYRQRCDHGLPAKPNDYSSQFGVDTSRWHAPARDSQASNNGKSLSGVRFPECGTNMLGFELIAELGRGAFGRVYLARQEDLANRFVAVKITRRATSEPERLAQMQHANIVPVYSVHRVDSLQAICMPFVGSSTLADVLADIRSQAVSTPASGHAFLSTVVNSQESTMRRVNESLPDEIKQELHSHPARPTESTFRSLLEHGTYETAILEIARQLVSGLAHAHRCGVVHRDLKPANILILPDGRPLILDFNMATSLDGMETGSVVGGTLPYMAPEHLEALISDGRVGKTADIFSVGVILYELLMQVPPYPERKFAGEDSLRTMIGDRRTLPTIPSEQRLKVTAGAISIVRKCLAANPLDRYDTAEQLGEDLKRQLHSLPLKWADNISLVERLSKWRRRHSTRMIVLTSVGIMLLICASFLFLWQWRGTHYAQLQAQNTWTQFQAQSRESLAALSLEPEDRETYGYMQDISTSTISIYDWSKDWQQQTTIRHLPPSQQLQLVTQTRHMLTMLGKRTSSWASRSGAADQQDLKTAADEYQTLAMRLGSSDNSLGENTYNQIYNLRLECDRLTSERDFRSALKLLDQLEREYGEDVSIWFRRANCHLGLKEFSRAEACYGICINLWGESHLPYLYRGFARLKLQLPGQAAEDFSQAIALKPGSFSAHFNRALARDEQGDVEGAIVDLTAAMSISTSQTRVFFLRSRLLHKVGRQEAAKRDFERGLNATPNDAKSWVAKGVALMETNNAAALACFQAALKISPDDEFAYENIAAILEATEHLKEALENVNVWIEHSPANGRAVAIRAVYHARMNRRDAAVRDAKHAVTLSQGGEELYRVACVFAILSEVEFEPIMWKYLAMAFRDSPYLARVALSDPDLKSLHQKQRFRALVFASAKLHEAADSSPQPVKEQ